MFLISETLYSHAYNTEAPHQIIHQGITPQWYFQQPPPGYGQQDPPGPLQHHQNSPQTMMPNSHATLTAAQHHPILMQQHGQATVSTSLKKNLLCFSIFINLFQYQMMPNYHQNIALYANHAGVQWHPQGLGVHYHQDIGYVTNVPPPIYIPNQSSNPRPQTPPCVAPTVTPSVSTKGITPGEGLLAAYPMVTSMQISMPD